MKVYVNKHNKQGKVVGRKVVNAELIQERGGSVVVKLPDGNIVVRKKNRDIPDAESQQPENQEQRSRV